MIINNKRARKCINTKSNKSAHVKGTVDENLCNVGVIRIVNGNCPVNLRGGGLNDNEEKVPLAVYKGIHIFSYDDLHIGIFDRHTNIVEKYFQ